MADKMTDAELIARLRMREKHGPVTAAKALGISTRQLRESVTEAALRNITASSNPAGVLERVTAQLKIANAEIAQIKRENLTTESVLENIYGLSALPIEPVSWLSAVPPSTPRGPKKTVSVPVLMLSDLHWGEVVDPDELNGLNKFNRKIAKQRLRAACERTYDLAHEHMGAMDYPGIVVCLGGDILSGNIHEELTETNEGPLQKSLMEAQDEIAAALEYFADKFGHVFVPCVVGNHGRTTKKPRAKSLAFDSYEWNIYQNLKRHFKNDKRVVFKISDNADVRFDVLGHKFLLTHGDRLGTKGGDGLIGAIGPIMRGVVKIGRAEAHVGRDFDTMIIGHWHCYMPRGEMFPCIVNGTLKGHDEYAHSVLRVPYSRPCQALCFVHAKHGVTAQWQVFVDDDARKGVNAKNWVRFEDVTGGNDD